jgi:hypothetical protein
VNGLLRHLIANSGEPLARLLGDPPTGSVFGQAKRSMTIHAFGHAALQRRDMHDSDS